MEATTLSPVEALLGAFPFAAAVIGPAREVVAANLIFENEFGGPTGTYWLAALEDVGPTDDLLASLRRLTERAARAGETLRFPAAPSGTGARWFVHLRRLRYEAADQVLVVFEPLAGGDPLRARLEDLEAHVEALRKMKHEVSNPLMGLVGNAELLATDPSLAADARRKAQAILEQARRMCEQISAVNHPVD